MLTVRRLTLLPFLLALAASAQTPTIRKIDPPNWFATLPSPTLLIQGENLQNARITTSDPTIRLNDTKISPNGHWAIVTLDTQSARAETIRLTATTPAGTTTVPYILKPRNKATAAGFSPADVMYLIMPDRFADGDPKNNQPDTYNRAVAHAYHGGDLRGVIDHLDYLQQLGVTALWLTPVLANDPKGTDYHGYGATDMYAVDPHLGTLAEYRELADALHNRHMRLIFDDVPNHVGPNHIWATDPPLPDWFHGTAANHLDNKYQFHPDTDPHAAPEAARDALDGWFVNSLPDMNQQNPVVARYELQNMIWWIEESGLDGLRIDTFPYVQRSFWQYYLGELKRLYPRLTSVGEVSDGDPTVNAFYEGGRTVLGSDTHLDTPFDYPLYYSLLDVLVKGRPMSQLENTLRQDWLYPHPENLVPFIGNHDQVRFMSQPSATPALLRLGFGLLMTLRGTPELYSGDEIAMQGGEDPDNRRDFPGGFPGDKTNAFTSAGRTGDAATIHDWVAALGAYRAKTPALQGGAQQTLLAADSTFAYLRMPTAATKACGQATGSVLIALNRDPKPQTLAVPVEGTALAGCATMTPVLGDATTPVTISGASASISLPPFGIGIYTLR